MACLYQRYASAANKCRPPCSSRHEEIFESGVGDALSRLFHVQETTLTDEHFDTYDYQKEFPVELDSFIKCKQTADLVLEGPSPELISLPLNITFGHSCLYWIPASLKNELAWTRSTRNCIRSSLQSMQEQLPLSLDAPGTLIPYLGRHLVTNIGTQSSTLPVTCASPV